MTQTLPFDIPLDAIDAPPAKPAAKSPAKSPAPHKEKSAQAFKTISEVAEELDVPAHVLRFWESKFSQISPLKRGGGRRYYRPGDVALIKGVRALLYDQGLTIKGLQKLMRDRGAKHVAAIGQGEAALVVEETSDAAQAAPVKAAGRPDLHATISRLEKLRDQLRG